MQCKFIVVSEEIALFTVHVDRLFRRQCGRNKLQSDDILICYTVDDHVRWNQCRWIECRSVPQFRRAEARLVIDRLNIQIICRSDIAAEWSRASTWYKASRRVQLGESVQALNTADIKSELGLKCIDGIRLTFGNHRFKNGVKQITTKYF